MGCHFQDQVINDSNFWFACPLLLSLLLTPIDGDTMLSVALWIGPRGKELRAASSQKSTRNWILSPSLGWIWECTFPSWPLRFLQPSWYLDYSLWETLKQRPQLSHVQVSDTYKLWDHKYCFKSLSFGVICYAVIDNQYSAPSSKSCHKIGSPYV